MRKQNAKTTVPLDVVPERRTKRFPPRFRPVGRFCELRFRYLSSPTGREGEISRPLDYMRPLSCQIFPRKQSFVLGNIDPIPEETRNGILPVDVLELFAWLERTLNNQVVHVLSQRGSKVIFLGLEN